MEICLRFWIEKDGKHVMGKGDYEILKAVDMYSSLSKASKSLGMSYRFAWDYIRRMEEVLGEKVVDSKRGGDGGGRTVLTPLGKRLIRLYESIGRSIGSKGVWGIVESVEGCRVTLRVETCDFEVGEDVFLLR